MQRIIGRKEEIATLNRLKSSSKSEFVAVYGRRRVGKTFLIKSVFEESLHFQLTGTADVPLSHQLKNFQKAFQKVNPEASSTAPQSWFDALHDLSLFLEGLETEQKKVIFLDELPWLDSQNSYFIQALEHFWNSWASYRSDVLLIVCGSAASWIINKLINNSGGLHNRLTERIFLQPFTLAETEAFLQQKGSRYERYEILEIYMIMGGIPYYLENIQTNRSVAQNIDRMFYEIGGLLTNEYANLYRSLFKEYDKHTLIINALSQKAKGLYRKELLQSTKLSDGGGFTRLLDELEHSGFIRKYFPFGYNSRNVLYQLIDPFSLFYLTFVKNSRAKGKGAWINQLDNPKWKAWSGYAFEYLCWYHIDMIKKNLGIANVYTEESPWRSKKSASGAQIDLLIDRKDRIINICEMKFSTKPFTITKAYAENLRNKMLVFKEETGTKKTLFLTIIAASGTNENQYTQNLVQDILDLNALFE